MNSQAYEDCVKQFQEENKNNPNSYVSVFCGGLTKPDVDKMERLGFFVNKFGDNQHKVDQAYYNYGKTYDNRSEQWQRSDETKSPYQYQDRRLTDPYNQNPYQNPYSQNPYSQNPYSQNPYNGPPY